MVGIEPTTPKAHGLSTTPFVKVISGVLVRLTTCKRLTNSLPKLSLITTPHQAQNFCYMVDDVLVSDFRLTFGWAASPGHLLFSHINSGKKSRVRGHTNVLEP